MNNNNIFIPKVSNKRDIIRLICGYLNTHGGGSINIGFDHNAHLIGVNSNIYDDLNSAIKSINPDPTKHIRFHHDEIFTTADGKIGFFIIVEQGSALYEFEGNYYIVQSNLLYSYKEHDKAKMLAEYTASKLPPIKEFLPSDRTQKIELLKTLDKNTVGIYTIGELPKGNYLYKYLDLETFLISLKNDTIRFVEPTMWQDKYESRFYNANYSQITDKASNTPFLYACCFTYSGENEAAWKVYSYQKKGIGSHCVELRINRNKLRKQLVSHLTNCNIYIGKVEYINSYYINTLHAPNEIIDGVKNPTKYYSTYFKNFNLYSYLNLLLLKREAFLHEKEIRFFIIPNDADSRKKSYYNNDELEKKSEPEDIKIDWLDIIEYIQIDSSCSEIEFEILSDRINNLIDARKDLSDDHKKMLKKKLTPTKFNVYGKAEHITIGKDIIKTSK